MNPKYGIVSFLVTVVLVAQTVCHLRGIGKTEVVPAAIGQFDRDTGWSNKPGTEAISYRTGEAVTYKINADGFRGLEISKAKNPKSHRVILLGGSRTFGLGVPLESTFATLLGGYFSNLEIINASVAGFGIDQMLIQLDLKLRSYAPDLLLIHLTRHEPRHMLSSYYGKAKPRFELSGKSLSLVALPDPPAENFWQKLQPTFMSYLKLTDLRRALGLTAPARLFRSLAATSVQTAEPEMDHPPPEYFEQANRIQHAILLRFRQITQSLGCRIVVIAETGELARAARAAGIEVVDVSSAVENDRFSLPFGLQHVNSAGNGVIAWEVARFLKTRSWMF